MSMEGHRSSISKQGSDLYLSFVTTWVVSNRCSASCSLFGYRELVEVLGYNVKKYISLSSTDHLLIFVSFKYYLSSVFDVFCGKYESGSFQ